MSASNSGVEVNEGGSSAREVAADAGTRAPWQGPSIEHLAGVITRSSMVVTGTT